MKRGFLNSSKAKATPLGPVSPHVSSKPAASYVLSGLAQLPSSGPTTIDLSFGKFNKVALPDGYDAGKILVPDMVNTTLPHQEVLTSLPRFPQPLIHPKTPAFRVANVPGKGVGLFSTRSLAEGDFILSERPLIINSVGLQIPIPPHFTYEQFVHLLLIESEKGLKVAVDRMRPDHRAAFMALANCHTEDGSGLLLGITRTNGLCVSGLRPGVTGKWGNYSATCKYISRLNHSCSPNTQPLFDEVSLSYRLWAVRDIAAGEELTFQYIDVVCDAATRNEALKPYAFVCTCPSCTDAPASDARRAAIEAFTPTVSIWAVDRKLSNDWLVEKCAEKIALIETEGLQHLTAYFDATKAMMEAYICLGDARSTSKWAAKLNTQRWAENYTSVAPLLDPANAAYEAHPMWSMRAGDAPPGSFGKNFQDLAALAGPNGITTTPGGTGFMIFPGFPSR
ncbi:hypothetical protein B0H19DRAFT_1365554 [Mycena capillaripes]|nr:hypothetical protein B0H19DRAFT_1365554 [Mycena capillaripes]